MESKLLPEEIRQKINTEAATKTSFSEDRDYTPISKGQFYGYIAGATEWAQWKVRHDEERKQRVHLGKENDLITANYNELKERCDKMADLLDEMKYYLGDLSSDDPVDVDMKKRDLSRINEAIAYRNPEGEKGREE